jgi:hypothetical protein
MSKQPKGILSGSILSSKHAAPPSPPPALINLNTDSAPVLPTHTSNVDIAELRAAMIAEAGAKIQKRALLIFLKEVSGELTTLDKAVYTNDTGLNRLKRKVKDWLDE